MGISIGSDSLYNATSSSMDISSKTNELKNSLTSDLKDATDEELMNVCKSFESYFVEQIFKGMEKTIPKAEEDENEYVEYFGDMLYEQYASAATENSEIGLATMLYESMKRN